MISTAKFEATSTAAVTALAEGDPAADSRAFRRCLGQFATGVTVITAQVGEERVGVTANSFSSLSLDPPLVLWSIAKSSRSYESFSRAQHFAIYVLADDQIELSQRFSSSASDKYEGLLWRPGAATGAPILSGAAAVLECQIEAKHDGGDHVILVGRVRQFSHYNRDVLLFVRGRYSAAIDHPGLPAALPGGPAVGTLSSDDNRLYMLVFRAFNAMAEAFDHHRSKFGFSVAQSRVLIAFDRTPFLTCDAISRLMYLSLAAAEDAIASLSAKGCVEAAPGGLVRLTAKGASLRKALAEQELAFDTAQTKGFSAEDIATVKRALHAIAEQRA